MEREVVALWARTFTQNTDHMPQERVQAIDGLDGQTCAIQNKGLGGKDRESLQCQALALALKVESVP